jgi:hypothetical protein
MFIVIIIIIVIQDYVKIWNKYLLLVYLFILGLIIIKLKNNIDIFFYLS